MDEAFVNSESDPSAHPLDLLGLLLILWSRRLFLLCATVAALLLGLTIAYLIKPSFTSTAIVLPPQQQPSSAAALMSQLGSLTSLAGPSSLGLKSPSEMYVGLLKSRTVADAIIRRFDLAQVYKSSKMVELRKKRWPLTPTSKRVRMVSSTSTLRTTTQIVRARSQMHTSMDSTSSILPWPPPKRHNVAYSLTGKSKRRRRHLRMLKMTCALQNTRRE